MPRGRPPKTGIEIFPIKFEAGSNSGPAFGVEYRGLIIWTPDIRALKAWIDQPVRITALRQLRSIAENVRRLQPEPTVKFETKN